MDLFGWTVGGGFALLFLLLCEVFWGRRVSLVFGLLLGGAACQIGLHEAMTVGALSPLAANLLRLLVPVLVLDVCCAMLTRWPRKIARATSRKRQRLTSCRSGWSNRSGWSVRRMRLVQLFWMMRQVCVKMVQSDGMRFGS